MGSIQKLGRHADAAQAHAAEAAHEAKPWVERLARVGYAAKGVVYVVIGLLALQAAVGPGGDTTGAEGALVTILRQPFGQFLLGVVAVGLAGYALWRLVQAVADPEHKGTDAKGIVKRLGYATSGITYGALAWTAVQMLRGLGQDNGGSTQDWTARLLGQPLGQFLVGAAGLVILAIAANAFYIAFKAKFREKLKLAEMSEGQEKAATVAGRIGYTARGVVLGIIGVFLLRAAFASDPNQARGLAGVLKVLAQQPYGPWVLGVVAAGLVAYGAYQFVEGRYRRIMGE